ncbi:hypothetical protein CHARACLAT_006340 [Characodon lateralis]|uniref:Uncharacterized protein n=1 Tax=Characodon lateralis TaxID=208331 RepID=A0ABU7CYE6_9TELE|nr:hypothetical protein [Characodon lateralis]
MSSCRNNLRIDSPRRDSVSDYINEELFFPLPEEDNIETAAPCTEQATGCGQLATSATRRRTPTTQLSHPSDVLNHPMFIMNDHRCTLSLT